MSGGLASNVHPPAIAALDHGGVSDLQGVRKRGEPVRGIENLGLFTCAGHHLSLPAICRYGDCFFCTARFTRAQPSFTTCRERPIANASSGTSFVIQDPAA